MSNIIVSGENKINLEVFKTTASISEEDKVKVREYAKLMKAKEDVVKQLNKLENLIETLDSKWCKKHLWTNQMGEVVPLFDIDDDYLKNIVGWLIKNDNVVSKEIKKEYYSRFGYTDLIGESTENKYAPKKSRSNTFKPDWAKYSIFSDYKEPQDDF